MKTQRGFIGLPILIAVVFGLVVVGGGTYFVVQQNSPSPVVTDTENLDTLPIANDQVQQQNKTTPPAATGLTITYPSAGTTLSAGQQITIQWNIPSSVTSSFPSDFQLGLFLNVVRTDVSATNVYGINDGTNDPRVGSVVWKIPADIAPGTYRIESYLSAQPKDFSRMCAVTVGKDCSPNEADRVVMMQANQYKTESGLFTVKSLSAPKGQVISGEYTFSDMTGLAYLHVPSTMTTGQRTQYSFGDGVSELNTVAHNQIVSNLSPFSDSCTLSVEATVEISNPQLTLHDEARKVDEYRATFVRLISKGRIFDNCSNGDGTISRTERKP